MGVLHSTICWVSFFGIWDEAFRHVVFMPFSDTAWAFDNRGTLAALVYKFIFIEPEENAAPIKESECSKGDLEMTSKKPNPDEVPFNTSQGVWLETVGNKTVHPSR